MRPPEGMDRREGEGGLMTMQRRSRLVCHHAAAVAYAEGREGPSAFAPPLTMRPKAEPTMMERSLGRDRGAREGSSDEKEAERETRDALRAVAVDAGSALEAAWWVAARAGVASSAAHRSEETKGVGLDPCHSRPPIATANVLTVIKIFSRRPQGCA